MDVSEKRINDIIIMDIAGRVDHFCSDILEQELSTIIQTGLFKIILDLHNCTFLSADALRIFIKTHQRTIKYQGHVALCSPSEHIKSLLEFVNARKAIPIFTHLDSALSQLCHSPSGKGVAS